MTRTRLAAPLLATLLLVAGCSLPFLGDDRRTDVTMSVGGSADHGQVEKILRDRVTGAGMRDPDFSWKDGSVLVMTVPGDHGEADFGRLMSPGRLEFRKVLGRTPGPDASCPGPASASRPGPAEGQILACDTDKVRYTLDVAKVVRSDISSAKASLDSSGQHTVTISFTPVGQAKFTELSREAVGNAGTPPCAQDALGDGGNCLVAIVLDGSVLSAPEILVVLTGDAQIAGSFTKEQAKLLAAQLDTDELPVAATVTDVVVRG